MAAGLTMLEENVPDFRKRQWMNIFRCHRSRSTTVLKYEGDLTAEDGDD